MSNKTKAIWNTISNIEETEEAKRKKLQEEWDELERSDAAETARYYSEE